MSTPSTPSPFLPSRPNPPWHNLYHPSRRPHPNRPCNPCAGCGPVVSLKANSPCWTARPPVAPASSLSRSPSTSPPVVPGPMAPPVRRAPCCSSRPTTPSATPSCPACTPSALTKASSCPSVMSANPPPLTRVPSGPSPSPVTWPSSSNSSTRCMSSCSFSTPSPPSLAGNRPCPPSSTWLLAPTVPSSLPAPSRALPPTCSSRAVPLPRCSPLLAVTSYSSPIPPTSATACSLPPNAPSVPP